MAASFEIIHGITTCGEPNVSKQTEGEISDVSDVDDDAGTYSTQASDLSSDELASFDHNDSVSEQLEYQYGRDGNEASDNDGDQDYNNTKDNEAVEFCGSSQSHPRIRRMKQWNLSIWRPFYSSPL